MRKPSNCRQWLTTKLRRKSSRIIMIQTLMTVRNNWASPTSPSETTMPKTVRSMLYQTVNWTSMGTRYPPQREMPVSTPPWPAWNRWTEVTCRRTDHPVLSCLLQLKMEAHLSIVVVLGRGQTGKTSQAQRVGAAAPARVERWDFNRYLKPRKNGLLPKHTQCLMISLHLWSSQTAKHNYVCRRKKCIRNPRNM